MPPRAFGYLRVSDDSQAGERNVSLEDQLKSYREYCARKNYQPTQTFTDVFSGRRDDRPEYRRMLALLQRKEAEVVVVKFLDRFGRKPRTILRHLWALQDLGIAVEATDEDLTHELLTLVKAGLAGEQVKRIGEVVKSAMRRVAERGQRVGPLSLGLNVDENRRITIDEEWAPLARRIFGLYVRGDRQQPGGYGYRKLVAYLNGRGLFTKAGRPWSPSTVKFILKDRAMVGEVSQAGVAHVVPPVVCPGVFELAQQRMAARDVKRQAPVEMASGLLLSGLLFCAHCGRRMRSYSSSRKYYAATAGEWRRAPDQYYMCGSKMDFGLCQSNSVAARKLHERFLAELSALSEPAVLSALAAERLERMDRERDELAARERELRQELARLDERIVRQVLLWERGVLDEQQLQVASREARAQRRAAAEELATVEARLRGLVVDAERPEELAAVIQQIRERLDGLSVAEARGLLATVVERLVWDGQRLDLHPRW